MIPKLKRDKPKRKNEEDAIIAEKRRRVGK
jgi:hypothetical protein